MAEQNVYFTVKELAEYLGFTVPTIYDLMFKKKIPYSKPWGKRALFLRSDIDALFMANRIPTKAEIEQKVNDLKT